METLPFHGLEISSMIAWLRYILPFKYRITYIYVYSHDNLSTCELLTSKLFVGACSHAMHLCCWRRWKILNQRRHLQEALGWEISSTLIQLKKQLRRNARWQFLVLILSLFPQEMVLSWYVHAQTSLFPAISYVLI